jgi:hypothetical protein
MDLRSGADRQPTALGRKVQPFQGERSQPREGKELTAGGLCDAGSGES